MTIVPPDPPDPFLPDSELPQRDVATLNYGWIYREGGICSTCHAGALLVYAPRLWSHLMGYVTVLPPDAAVTQCPVCDDVDPWEPRPWRDA